MNLLNFVPNIQDAIVHLPAVERSRDAISERHLRQIAAAPLSRRQTEMWAALANHAKQRSGAEATSQ
jgi:hypothetical protein